MVSLTFNSCDRRTNDNSKDGTKTNWYNSDVRRSIAFAGTDVLGNSAAIRQKYPVSSASSSGDVGGVAYAKISVLCNNKGIPYGHKKKARVFKKKDRRVTIFTKIVLTRFSSRTWASLSDSGANCNTMDRQVEYSMATSRVDMVSLSQEISKRSNTWYGHGLK